MTVTILAMSRFDWRFGCERATFVSTVSCRFDPRRDDWQDHFVFLHNYLFIVGISSEGEATEKALGFNDSGPNGPLGTRHDAVLVHRYPPPWAHQWRFSVS
jgi:hypothetical protein